MTQGALESWEAALHLTLLKAGEGKKKAFLFHQGHRTSATELLHKERDGNSKNGEWRPPGWTNSQVKSYKDRGWISGKKDKIDKLSRRFVWRSRRGHAAPAEGDPLRGVTLTFSFLLKCEAFWPPLSGAPDTSGLPGFRSQNRCRPVVTAGWSDLTVNPG